MSVLATITIAPIPPEHPVHVLSLISSTPLTPREFARRTTTKQMPLHQNIIIQTNERTNGRKKKHKTKSRQLQRHRSQRVTTGPMRVGPNRWSRPRHLAAPPSTIATAVIQAVATPLVAAPSGTGYSVADLVDPAAATAAVVVVVVRPVVLVSVATIGRRADRLRPTTILVARIIIRLTPTRTPRATGSGRSQDRLEQRRPAVMVSTKTCCRKLSEARP